MHDSEIIEIADKLIRNSDSKEAYFGIAEQSSDQFYIKANKDGLMLYAAELLYASTVDNNSRIWGVHREWIDDTILELAYIKLIDEKTETLTSASATSKIIRRLRDIGCVLLVGVLGFLLLIGAVVIFKRIFEWI